MMYKVWSRYPPALARHASGGRQIVGGTIDKIEADGYSILTTTELPSNTTLAQLTWMRPIPAPSKPLMTKTVAGSKGKSYTVTTLPTGRKTCTCSGYTFRKTCKHIGA
jgi:hypothetical protein